MRELQDFIVRAKAASYVGGGEPAPSCRPGSHDLAFAEGRFTYLDSYFGGTDFAGQELISRDGEPVWAENYFGRILRDDLITGAGTGALIREALSALYAEGRFLGGYRYERDGLTYIDMSEGDASGFFGYEEIRRGDIRLYELRYCGGLIRA
jgi:hypothetical protein